MLLQHFCQCIRNTRKMLKSDRFAPNIVWNHSLFWLFLKGVKIKVLFVSAWLLTKSCFCAEPAHGGRWKNADHFFNSRQKFCEVFFTKGLHKGFFAVFCHCPDHYRNRRDTPPTQKVKAKVFSFAAGLFSFFWTYSIKSFSKTAIFFKIGGKAGYLSC